MITFRQNFRKWWQPPRNISEREEERSVSFLELFYDLIYVVLVAEVAHTLAQDVTVAGVIGFVYLFIIVWWAWLNGAIYHDLHGNNDIRTRVFTFLQMGSVAAMAVFAHNALSDGAIGFALSYAAFQLILTWLWWRTGVHDPAHRPLARPYVVAFLFTTMLFVVSVFVPAPLRFYLWGVAVLISLLLPFFTLGLGSNDPALQEQIDRSTAVSPSLAERFGLLTIIVLGEVIVGTVRGVAEHHHLSWLVGITAALAMLIAIGIWWIYFDFISHHLPRPGIKYVMRWLYVHLPMTMGIAAVGAAVLNVVEHAGTHIPAEVRWLLVGAVAVVLICIAILMRNIQIPTQYRPMYQTGFRIIFISGLIILLLGFTQLDSIPLLILLVVFMLSPIFYGIKVWIELLDGEEAEVS